MVHRLESCVLNNTGHTASAGSTIDPGLVNTSAAFNAATNPAAGAFIYRNANGTGNVNFTNLRLRWNYGANGLSDHDSVEICVYAIEVVNIPQNNFFVGDNNAASVGRFVTGTTTTPFQITSEAALTIGNTATSELYGTSAAGTSTIGVGGVLPAVFPKGYQAFYCMKYELSQGMYKEYLNKLTRTQQATVTSNNLVGRYMSNNTLVPTNRNGVKVMSDPGGALRRVYGNDLNNNNSSRS